MQSIKPSTYHELMQYKRCLELRRYIPETDDALFVKTYQHMTRSDRNTVGVSDGKMVFYESGDPVESIAVSVIAAITAISLSATALHVERPYTHTDSGDSSGSSNNNNNNNNNNNG